MTPPPIADRITLGSLVKGAVQGLPLTPRLLRGLWNLVSIKPDSPRSLGLLLQEQAARMPAAPALSFEDQVWSYAELNAWANRIAHHLRQQGLKPGDAVALMMENRPLVLAAVAGIVKLGGVAVMLNYQQRGDVLAHSLRLTAPRFAIVGSECAEAWDSAEQPDSLRDTWWDGPAETLPPDTLGLRSLLEAAGTANPAGVEQIRASSTCFYIFTSGTTGLPKASRMTHYRWLRGMAGLGQLGLKLGGDDVLYCCLPLYHNNALTVSWGATLGSGACLALGRKFSASRFWDEIRAHRATAFCYIGELCRYLLNQPSSPRDRDHAVHAVIGNGLRPELWGAFQERFGIERISEFYGASESNLAFVNGFNQSRTAGFCPLPFSVVAFDAESEAPVRGRDGFFKAVQKGGVGLLITEVSEKLPFDGYTDPKASEAKLFRNVFKAGDCWFNTGDLVRDQGFRHIQFVDRVGDTFRWKGENVATTEVEGALARFPGCQQAVVYGVEIPGADGRAGMAAVTLADGFDGQALAAHLSAELPPYAVPLFLRLKTDQEVTGTFKYRKVDLKREGFDPSQVSDPLYVRLSVAEGYVPLTEERLSKIRSGEWRG